MLKAPVFTGAFYFSSHSILNFTPFTWPVRFPHEPQKKTANMKTEVQTSQVMRQARLRLHITQFTLSRRVGCSESQITKIETGRTEPAQWLKEAIARELNIQTWEVGV